MNTAIEVVAYDPNAPLATAPIAIIGEENVEVMPPDEEFITDFDIVGERLTELFEEGQMSEECYDELVGYVSLLRQNGWYKRVEKRMSRERNVKQKLTDDEKAESPDYKLCDYCCEYVKRQYYDKIHTRLKKHNTNKIHMTMRRTDDNKKKVDAKLVYSAKKIYDGMDRIITNMKNKEPELEEESLYEPNTILYMIKTWDTEGNYTGLYEIDGEKYFTNMEDAYEKYNWAIDSDDRGAVELIEKTIGLNNFEVESQIGRAHV